MVPHKFLTTLQALHGLYQDAKKLNLNLELPPAVQQFTYDSQKKSIIINTIPTRITQLIQAFSDLETHVKCDDNDSLLLDMRILLKSFDQKKFKQQEAEHIIDELARLAAEITYPTQTTIGAPIKSIPLEIRGEINADIQELQMAFNAGCYRSAVILCGRVLEVALHRKYFESTGHDVLEKSPGIGLGNLLAKMREQNIYFDPGLMNQVHMINMTRIFSVHKQQEPYHPTKDQAHAIIIYTLDVLRQLFDGQHSGSQGGQQGQNTGS